MNIPTDMHQGRGWARTGFWAGVASSIAANVAHAWIGVEDGWPSWLMLLFAVLPPFALLVGIEVIAQVRWRQVWYQYVIRWGAVGSVAAIGGIVSYDHMRAALEAHGEVGVGSYLLPVLVDGLMTVCSAALLTIGDNVRRAERAGEVPAEGAAEVEVLRGRVEAERARADEEYQRAEVLGAEATRLRRRLAEVPAEGSAPPAAKRAPRKAEAAAAEKPVRPVKATPRRPVEVTRKLATEALSAAPDTKRKDVAEQLDISDRRLRQVLNEPSGEQPVVPFADAYELARDIVRTGVRLDRPVTAEWLAEQFNESPEWGAERITEATVEGGGRPSVQLAAYELPAEVKTEPVNGTPVGAAAS